jgi:hypothetical protein
MTTPTLRAIKCSERMPTREDANTYDKVLWIDLSDGFCAYLEWNGRVRWATHFFPLNRYAIATDAEEQRGEGGE